jgi:hypothetical protein
MSKRSPDMAIGPPPVNAKRAKIAAAPIASCANAKSAKAYRIEALVSRALAAAPHAGGTADAGIELDINQPEA